MATGAACVPIRLPPSDYFKMILIALVLAVALTVPLVAILYLVVAR
jgi:hypothetical protein